MSLETAEDTAGFCFNGVNATSGGYFFPQLDPDSLVGLAQGLTMDPLHLAELRLRAFGDSQTTLAPIPGVDPRKLEEAGWGVVFLRDADPLLLEALRELLDWRKMQASQNDPRLYQELAGPNGYLPGESKMKFLARHGVGPGPVDPLQLPYYLLLVGDPEAIPYSFQYQLDVQYAVGRIWFETVEEFKSYAHTVVDTEKATMPTPRRAVFFGVMNQHDRATKLSSQELVVPLARKLGEEYRERKHSWEIESYIGECATKRQLSSILESGKTPSLLFTASHGVGFDNGDPIQLLNQGGLLCQDWPGPLRWPGPIPSDHYYSAESLPKTAKLSGMIAFHFACFGAGTPRYDDFVRPPTELGPHAFLARLPCHMLGLPNGGALAVVGHVARVWGCSFLWEDAGRQVQTFESTLRHLMQGVPIGASMEFFNSRYAELATEITTILNERDRESAAPVREITGLWTALNDARNYVVLGDPAVRISTG